MNIENIIAAIVVAAIIAGVVFYIYRSKKHGQKCIGCPYAESCKSRCCKNNRK